MPAKKQSKSKGVSSAKKTAGRKAKPKTKSKTPKPKKELKTLFRREYFRNRFRNKKKEGTSGISPLYHGWTFLTFHRFLEYTFIKNGICMTLPSP